jgi:dTDP-glucose 4,6-dehydratase
VEGFIAALVGNSGQGEVVNIGSSFEISIAETAHIIAEVMEAPIELISDVERLRPENSEVERLWADNAKSKELFGWQPTYAGREGFRRGLVETIDWFTQPGNLRSYKSDIYNV